MFSQVFVYSVQERDRVPPVQLLSGEGVGYVLFRSCWGGRWREGMGGRRVHPVQIQAQAQVQGGGRVIWLEYPQTRPSQGVGSLG